MEKQLILILGGARSGKSVFAQNLAKELGEKVLFIATAKAEDEEMRQRIEEHRRARPAHWRTLEEPLALVQAIEEDEQRAQGIIIDCLTLWLSNFLSHSGFGNATAIPGDAEIEKRALGEMEALLRCWQKGPATFIVVSNEVGMGLVPPYPLGRLYRDLLGRVNQLVAARATQVYLLCAGLPLRLKG